MQYDESIHYSRARLAHQIFFIFFFENVRLRLDLREKGLREILKRLLH
jgi:hypothetical protein